MLLAGMLFIILALETCQIHEGNSKDHCSLLGSKWLLIKQDLRTPLVDRDFNDTMFFRKVANDLRLEAGYTWEFVIEKGLPLWLYEYSPEEQVLDTSNNGFHVAGGSGVGSGLFELQGDTLAIYRDDTTRFKIRGCNDTTLEVVRIRRE